MLIGDKKKFAIEFDIIDFTNLYGKINFWLSNICVGQAGEDDTTYIRINIEALYRIKDLSNIVELDDKKVSKKDILKNLLNENFEQYDLALLSFSETFDYLRIYRGYFYNENFVFIWQEKKNTFIHFHKIERTLLYQVLYETQAAIFNLKSEYYRNNS